MTVWQHYVAKKGPKTLHVTVSIKWNPSRVLQHGSGGHGTQKKQRTGPKKRVYFLFLPLCVGVGGSEGSANIKDINHDKKNPE